jgi:hypothetical protein
MDINKISKYKDLARDAFWVVRTEQPHETEGAEERERERENIMVRVM